MPDDDFSAEVEPRRLPNDQSGRISELERRLDAAESALKASRTGRGATTGVPPGDKELDARVTAVETFLKNLEGQNGIDVNGPIISLARKQDDKPATQQLTPTAAKNFVLIGDNPTLTWPEGVDALDPSYDSVTFEVLVRETAADPDTFVARRLTFARLAAGGGLIHGGPEIPPS